MEVFVDTSALVELLNADSSDFAAASRAWDAMTAASDRLVTTNYVITESAALLQNRFGMGAVRSLFTAVVPALEFHWVEPGEHESAVRTLLALGRRRLSLVDCISFDVMRRLGTERAFTLDEHFREQGFECLP